MHKFKVKMWKKIPKEIMKFTNEKATFDDYMNIYIFDNKEEMYDKVDKLEKRKVEREYYGRCRTCARAFLNIETNEKRYTAYCGNIYFLIDNMDCGTVSHECSHAIIGYFNHKIKDYNNIFEEYDFTKKNQYKDCDGHEELFCYMLGSLINQVYNKYLKIVE